MYSFPTGGVSDLEAGGGACCVHPDKRVQRSAAEDQLMSLRRSSMTVSRQTPSSCATRARTARVRYPAERCSARLARFSGKIRSEEHTSELQSLMRISYAGFCLT